MMEKFLYPNQPIRCIKTGPSSSGKSIFLTNLVLNIINEFEKIYFYSPSPYQDLYQKSIKCFSKCIPIHIIPNILNEEVIDIVNEEPVNNKDFDKSNIEVETYHSIEEVKFPQDYYDGGIIILDDFKE